MSVVMYLIINIKLINLNHVIFNRPEWLGRSLCSVLGSHFEFNFNISFELQVSWLV